eukprot:381405-Ditylum_brightwellii.AAC.1
MRRRGIEKDHSASGKRKIQAIYQEQQVQKKGHYANKYLDLIKNEEKGVSTFISKEEDELGGEDSNVRNEFIFLSAKHKMVNKNMLLFGNQSSTNIMCNRQYVTNIRKVNRMVTLNYCRHRSSTNYMCNVLGHGSSWFYKKRSVNILSLSKVKNRCCMTCNSENGNKFTVHKPGYGVDFIEGKNGLYYHDMSNMSMSFHITIMEGNRHILTQ